MGPVHPEQESVTLENLGSVSVNFSVYFLHVPGECLVLQFAVPLVRLSELLGRSRWIDVWILLGRNSRSDSRSF